jgi:hypothetical protein
MVHEVSRPIASIRITWDWDIMEWDRIIHFERDTVIWNAFLWAHAAELVNSGECPAPFMTITREHQRDNRSILTHRVQCCVTRYGIYHKYNSHETPLYTNKDHMWCTLDSLDASVDVIDKHHKK